MKAPYRGEMVEATELEFKPEKEEWNEYRAADGAILRLKVVVTNIARLSDKKDEEGNPIYVVKSSNILAVSRPKAGGSDSN